MKLQLEIGIDENIKEFKPKDINSLCQIITDAYALDDNTFMCVEIQAYSDKPLNETIVSKNINFVCNLIRMISSLEVYSSSIVVRFDTFMHLKDALDWQNVTIEHSEV